MNNLDMSSHGVNLDLSVSFDLCRSQNNFSENFTSVSTSGGSLLNDRYSNVNIWLFNDYGNYTKDFDLTDLDNYNLKSCTVKVLLGTILVTEYHNCIEDLRSDTLQYFSKYPYHMTKLELLELLKLRDTETYQQFVIDNFTPLFEVLEIRGHSQGDYAEIIFTNELMKEYNFDDKEKFLSMMGDYFTNLFYDAPLYARLEIDDQEIYLDDFQKDSYTYDKNEILEHAKKTIEHKQKDYIISWLSEELPDQPDCH